MAPSGSPDGEEVSSGGQWSLSLQVPVSLCDPVVSALVMGHFSSILYKG